MSVVTRISPVNHDYLSKIRTKKRSMSSIRRTRCSRKLKQDFKLGFFPGTFNFLHHFPDKFADRHQSKSILLSLKTFQNHLISAPRRKSHSVINKVVRDAKMTFYQTGALLSVLSVRTRGTNTCSCWASKHKTCTQLYHKAFLHIQFPFHHFQVSKYTC